MLNSRNYAVLTAVLSAAGLLPMSTMANISFTEGGERLINTLHTHLYSPSSGLSSSDEIKLAAVCFINDTSACSDEAFGNTENSGGNGGSGGAPDYDLNDAERCSKEGYTLTSCAAGETPEGFCIYNSNYFARCVCPAGYKTCEPPYYGVGTACGNKYASCEEDTERACKELDSEFTDTCQNGWKVDPNNACEYDPTYGKCCNLCEGYDYTSIPEGYIADGAACVDCNGTSKYKIKINPCEGFQDCGSMGGDTGAKTCMSGSQIKYDNCKPCPNLGTLSSCPSPFTCTYEECSNRYYKSGCQSGYDWNASAQTCTPQCASTYKYTCTGAKQTGGSGTACGGKYTACTCSSGYFWSNGSCVVNNDCMKGSQLGYILNRDMTVTTSDSYKAMAVIVCSYEGNIGGQAMALNPIGSYEWGGDGINISTLTNYGTSEAALTDYHSCSNTAKIIASGDESKYPAAWAAYNYTTTGTSIGDWCLPSAGILNSIYNNLSVINKGFTQINGTPFSDNIWNLWSSTEENSNFVWGYYSKSNTGLNYGNYRKNKSQNVRPVIGFCKSGYGYDKSTDSCKFCDSTYKYPCTGTNEIGSGTGCGGKYMACTCASGYKWTGSSCIEENACMKGSQLGYILNSDMTVTASKQSGKTPIGVVVCSYAGGGGQAMALKSIGKYKWLSNYLDIPTLPNNQTRDVVYKDTSSCENTAKIIAAGDSSAFPAAWAANEYSTEGTSAGDWCLPAAGVFTSYFVDQSVINSGFTLAGGTILTTSNYIWSSSENSTSTAWNSYFYGSYALEPYTKTTSREVRPVIEF